MAAFTAALPVVHARAAASFAGRQLRAAASNATGVKASAKLLWCPGGQGKLNPSYLNGTIPGDYGFDPLELAAVPENLARFREAELIHGRWAMLGAAGALFAEALGYGDWLSVQQKFADGEPLTYFGSKLPYGLSTVIFVEVLAVAWAESARQQQKDAEKRLYPGGSFDPMGLSKDAKTFAENKVKEVKNGRLAMLAWLGFLGQAASTGTSPLANLATHVADPFHASVAQNPVALPWL